MPKIAHLQSWFVLLLLAIAVPVASAQTQTQTQTQTRIAVMPFRGVGLTAQDAAFVDSLAEMLSTNLAESKDIQILERTQIKKALEALKVDASGVIDQDTAVKVGGWLGATHVVVGTLAALGDRVRLDSRVVSLQAGVVEKSARAEGTRKDLFDLINTLSSRVLAAFTGESIVFTEGPKLVMQKDFRLSVPTPSPNNVRRFVTSPLFEGTNPAVVVKFVVDYAPTSAPVTRTATTKPKGVGGWIGRIADTAGVGTSGVGATFTNATKVQLLVNDTAVATWTPDLVNSTMETQQAISLGGVPANLSIQTQRLVAGPIRTPNGETIKRITDVAVKVTIERQNP